MSNSVWDDAWNRAQSTLDGIRTSRTTSEHVRPRIIRVGQLDSELLDQELSHLLQEPVTKSLALIHPSLKSRFDPEIRFLIQLVLYRFSVWDTGASYGAKLQDLHYAVPIYKGSSIRTSSIPRRTLFIHALLTLVTPYLHTRLRTHALSHAWPDAPSSDIRRKAWNLLELLETIHASSGLVNFTLFLWNGQYRTLADHLLSMSLIPSRRQVKRDVSYEFMNRQMVWHAFTEFLLFLLPLIDVRTVRKRCYRIAAWCSPSTLLSFIPQKALKSIGISSSSTPGSTPRKKALYSASPDDQCAICAENASFNPNPSDQTNMFTAIATPILDSSEGLSPYPINVPYVTNCGHVYCYHCIAERMVRAADDQEPGWECLRCCEIVTTADRYSIEPPGSDDLNVSGSEYEFSSDLDMYTDLSGSMGSYSESALSE